MNLTRGNCLVGVAVISLVIACGFSPSHEFQTGLAYFKDQNYAAAARCFEKALACVPPTAQALNFLGVCRLHEGRRADALRHFNAALKLDTNNVPARYNLALALLEAGQADDAIPHLRQLAQKTAMPADTQYYLGLAYLRASAWLQARQSLQKAAEARPSAQLYNFLGIVSLHQGDFKQAQQDFEHAIKTTPKFAPAHLNLAVLEHQHLNQKQAALTHYQEYLDLLPKGQSREDIRLLIVKLSKELTAQPKPVEMVVAAPPKPVAPPKPAVTNIVAAAPATNVAAKPTPPPAPKPEPVALKPAAPIVPVKKTRVAITAPPLTPGDRAKAKPFFNDAIREHQKGQLAGAIALYNKAIAADPSFAQAYYNLAIACHDARQPDRCLDNYELALTANPGFTDARFNYAIVLNEQGYLDNALTQYEYLLKDNPNDAHLHLTAAALYARDKTTRTQARRHYEAYLKLVPASDPFARNIRAWLDQNP